MAICTLTNGHYNYETINLLDLHNTLMENLNLTVWDIYAFYNEVKAIENHKFDNPTFEKLDELKAQLEKLILDTYEAQQELAIATNQQLIADTEQYEAELLSICHAKGYTEITIRDLERYSYPYEWGITIEQHNHYNALKNKLGGIKFNATLLSYPEDKLNAIYNGLNLGKLGKLVDAHYDYRGGNDSCTKLLKQFNFTTFKKRKSQGLSDLDALGIDKNETYFEEVVYVTTENLRHDEHRISSSSFALCYELTAEELVSKMKQLIETILSETVLMPKEEYCRQLELSPIVLNRTAEGKVELVDGFKRVMLMHDKNYLDVDIPVKVYNDLTDTQYLVLLNATNAWKCLEGAPNFYDRGYIFSLTHKFKLDTFGKKEDLYTILNMYDVPTTPTATSPYFLEDIKSLLALNVDIKDLSEGTYSLTEKIKKKFIKLLAKERRTNTQEQREINCSEVLQQIYDNPTLYKKILSKEKLTVTGHIDNFIATYVSPELETIIKQAVLVD